MVVNTVAACYIFRRGDAKTFFLCGPTRGTHAMEWEHQPHGLNVAHAVSRSETGGLNFRLYYIKENLEIYKYLIKSNYKINLAGAKNLIIITSKKIFLVASL